MFSTARTNVDFPASHYQIKGLALMYVTMCYGKIKLHMANSYADA
jgi:hypothetical protein